ncbi:MAG: hypothetical protein JNK48_13185 [Bryobacterales bacterium]|nr:hypothetical protein [Bryobacterales bacterium]
MTSGEKQHALCQVLDSQSFARSGQLKKFLRYVCELEISGRTGEIKEYSIGTEALGRPADYSPAQDSSVRRRAFELRAKLEEVYQGELAASPILIELPKGSYVPVFRPRQEPRRQQETPRSPLDWRFLAVFAAGLLGGIGLTWFIPPSAGAASVVREAWGPIAAAPNNVLVSVAGGFHLAVRSGEFSTQSELPTFPAPPEIEPLFEKTVPRPEPGALLMRPTFNTTTIGALGAVNAAAASLQTFGVQLQILPERVTPLASLRNRNVILIGDPLTSFAAGRLLSGARLTVALDPQTKRLVIRDRQQPGALPAFARRTAAAGRETIEVFGLLTVLPSDASPGQSRRTLIVSGLSNAALQGAMEFFTSASQMAELKTRFQQQGHSGFPDAYQLVVRCSTQDSLPLSCHYAAHYALAPRP